MRTGGGTDDSEAGVGRRARLGVNIYPWDVVGDPECPERIAGLGADRVALAAAYHSARALTPRHPDRRVVTAAHSAVYFRPEQKRWRGLPLQPKEAAWAPRGFTEGAALLRAAGLKVYAWTVLTHNQRLGATHPEHAVQNAYGDSYPWALCINSPEVRRYCRTLAAEVASQPDIDGIEFESCGWYGYDHLHAHDKTAGVHFDPQAKALLNLCFCNACLLAYSSAGLNTQSLRSAVRTALDSAFAGDGASGEFSAHLREDVSSIRIQSAARLQAEVVAAARAAAPDDDVPILLHTSPDPLAVGANPGSVPDGGFGAVIQCPKRSETALADLTAYREAMKHAETLAATRAAQPLAATVNIVSGMGGRPDDLGAWLADLQAAGVDEFRLYHAGIASHADIEAVRRAGETLFQA